MKLRVGIDVGGTFTDVSVFDEDSGDIDGVTEATDYSGDQLS